MRILNGDCDGDREGEFTFVSHSGSSVNDYFLVSLDFPESKIVQVHVSPRVESQHMPVSLTLNTARQHGERATADQATVVTKLVWQDNLTRTFQNNVRSSVFTNTLGEATEQIARDPNKALDIFVSLLLNAAEPMKKTFFNRKGKKQGAPWFDSECRQSKQSVKRLLRRWKRTKGGSDRVSYVTERTKHHKLLQKKKREYEENKCEGLTKNLRDQQSFWKAVKNINRGAGRGNDISSEGWLAHFKSVFGTSSCEDNLSENTSEDDNDDDTHASEYDAELNQDIREDEVRAAIKNFKNGKSPGPDCMLGELLKNSQETVVPFLTSCFNHLFNNSLFPEQWSKALLVPIHKKGSINDPDNYRGISLLSILIKCYTYILNKRLEVWAESQGKLVEEQGGFRKGRSTVDHIFVMISMVEKALAKSKGKLYVAFVDFRTAYDSVNRNILWDVLRRAGVGGKMLRALRAMYSSVVAYVRVEAGCTTEEFSCPVGLKQGECSSPLLFSFINELATTVRDKGNHGVQFVQGMAEVFLLLFADDVALVSLTPGGLQNQLNNLKAEADRLKLEVNLAKTSIIVFRKGGHLPRHERWTYGDVELEVVNSYKYLGIALTTKLSTTQAVADFIPKAKWKIVTILKALRKINCTDWGVFSKIFDAQIQPALLYASEIWSTGRVETVEKVHLFAIKRFLRLSNKTPSIIVYGESGRYPLAVSSQIRSIKYWLRLLKLNQDRLSFGAYRCSQNMAERGKYLGLEK